MALQVAHTAVVALPDDPEYAVSTAEWNGVGAHTLSGQLDAAQLADGAVALASKVSGVLPVAHGGTGAADESAAQVNLIAPLAEADPGDLDGYGAAYVPWFNAGEGDTAYRVSLQAVADYAAAAPAPGGTNGQVQYNASGTLAGAAAVAYAASGTHVTVTAQSAAATPLSLVPAASATAPLLNVFTPGSASYYLKMSPVGQGPVVELRNQSSAQKHLLLSGTGSDGSSLPAGGVFIGLASNGSTINRQLVMGMSPADQAGEANFRFYFYAGAAGMDGFRADGTDRADVFFGNDTKNICFGGTGGFVSIPNTAKNYFLTEPAKVAAVFRAAGGQSANLVEVQNSGGTALAAVDKDGKGSFAGLQTSAANAWAKQQYFGTATLADATNIGWNLDNAQVAKVTLGGNRTLDNPANMKDGATYVLRILQDGTGSRTLAYGTAYKWPGGTAPVLSAGANALDIITFASDGTNMYGTIQKGFA